MVTVLTRTEPDARPLVGVALVALAVLFFALGDVLTKGLTARYPIPMIVAVRYLASLILLAVFVWPRMRSRLWKTERTGLVLLRGCTLALASLTMGLALRLMPVGETIAIMYVSPFAVMAIAVPLLGEKVAPVGWFFAILGFCGVLLIMRPGGGLDPVGVLWALLNAACATAYHLLTPVLLRSVETTKLARLWRDGFAWRVCDFWTFSVCGCLPPRTSVTDRACELSTFGLGGFAGVVGIRRPAGWHINDRHCYDHLGWCVSCVKIALSAGLRWDRRGPTTPKDD